MRALPIALVFTAAVLAVVGSRAARHPPEKPQAAWRSPAEPAVNLSFRELVADGPQLGPSKKALSLVGKRVRLIGFMVDMELPSKGGFFLTGMPVKLDESGGGIGDLPLANIFVISRFADGKEIPHRKGPLEMTGIFDVGYRADEDGRVSWFRLNLDGPMETQVSDNLPGEAPSVAPGERKKDGP